MMITLKRKTNQDNYGKSVCEREGEKEIRKR